MTFEGQSHASCAIPACPGGVFDITLDPFLHVRHTGAQTISDSATPEELRIVMLTGTMLLGRSEAGVPASLL